MKRVILTAAVLTLLPSLTNSEVSGKALIGIWMCKEASQGQGTISQIQFQENGRLDTEYSLRDMLWEYSDSPDMTVSGRWSMSGEILIIQSEVAAIHPRQPGLGFPGKQPLGEDVIVEMSNEPSHNLIHELSDLSFVFRRKGQNMNTHCIRKPD